MTSTLIGRKILSYLLLSFLISAISSLGFLEISEKASFKWKALKGQAIPL